MTEQPTREMIERALEIEKVRPYSLSPLVWASKAYLASLDASAPSAEPKIGRGGYYIEPDTGSPKDGTRGPQQHNLKVVPEFFDDLESGKKNFEIRYSGDRDFQVNDTLLLREWKSDGYTGRGISKVVSYILAGEQWGLRKNYVVMAIASPPVPQEGVSDEMVDVALAAFDGGPKDSQCIEENMRLALEAALAPLLEENARLNHELKWSRLATQSAVGNMKAAVERADTAEARVKELEVWQKPLLERVRELEAALRFYAAGTANPYDHERLPEDYDLRDYEDSSSYNKPIKFGSRARRALAQAEKGK